VPETVSLPGRRILVANLRAAKAFLTEADLAARSA